MLRPILVFSFTSSNHPLRTVIHFYEFEKSLKIITTIPIYFIYLADEIDNYMLFHAKISHELLLYSEVRENYTYDFKDINIDASPTREAFFE